MRKSILTLSVVAALAAPALAAAQPPHAVAAHRQHGDRQRLPVPRHLADLSRAGHPGRHRLRPRERLLRRQLELERQRARCSPAARASRWTSTAAGRSRSAISASTSARIYYYYPRAEFQGSAGNAKFDNWEIYLGASWKWLSGKFYYAVTDYFGLSSEQSLGGYWSNRDNSGALLGSTADSSGTYYLDLSATFPVTKELSVVAHYGKLEVNKYSELDYKDWKLGVTYDLNGWVLGAAYIDTDADGGWYYTGGSKGNKATGDATIVFSVMKTF